MKSEQQNVIGNMSRNLFWDMDPDQIDLDSCPSQIVQRVLEYGEWNDWLAIRSYYGMPLIVKCCQSIRTLDPIALAYICCISHTDKESFRCYQSAQLKQAHWNF